MLAYHLIPNTFFFTLDLFITRTLILKALILDYMKNNIDLLASRFLFGANGKNVSNLFF